MIDADLVVREIGLLATMAGPVPRRGRDLADLAAIENAALAAFQGRIVFVGKEQALSARVSLVEGGVTLTAEGAAVVPGFVDAHSHIAFAGNRDDEIRRRLSGASYGEIAEAGGGILSSVRATRGASREELEAGIRGRLDEMLLQGTTTAEVKSGYGLDTEAEIRSLEAIRKAASLHPVTVVPTFLGAHEVPPEHRSNRERYVAMVVEDMLPEVAMKGLATFVDVFCEENVFTVAESRRILEAGASHGLGLRIHADEFAASGGAELAAEMKARSADHLLFVSSAAIKAMAAAGCTATLLPAAAFYLRVGRFAPARALVKASVAVALATDSNPGGGLSPSMPFAMTVACFQMGLSLEEALAAATLNAAYSLNVHEDLGSLEVGKSADFVVLRSRRLLDLVSVGVPAIALVVKGGKVVVRDGKRCNA